MPSLSLLIKPASGGCNVRCRYCFYADEQQNRGIYSYGLMSEETLEALIQKALSYATQNCSFGFQGGEPTLRGLEFFQKAVALQKKYNIHGAQVANAIQTNGLLIDESWARFFHDNHFLVGLSLDGTKDIHDENRLDPEGKGTYSRVLRAAQILTAHQADFNILTVVTGKTAHSITKIYNFFRRSGLLYQQYIPCLDPLEAPRGASPCSLTPAQYGKFLKTLFDLWYRDVTAGNFIYIRYFENLVGMLLGRPPESCGLSGQCTVQHVVEADGSVYPCDFYCLDQWKLGTVQEDGFPALSQKEKALAFISSSKSLADACRDCPYFFLCRGGCRRDKEPLQGGGTQENYFCPSYKAFFAYALPRLREIARVLGASQRGGGLL